MTEKIKCTECGGEYVNIEKHMSNFHSTAGGAPFVGQLTSPILQSGTTVGLEAKVDNLADMMSKLVPVVTDLASKMERIQTGGRNDYKKGILDKDVQAYKSSREGIDPRTVAIVDEILGEDFGVVIEPNKENPGFLFSILVPHRLSDLPIMKRPVLNQETGEYMKDKFNNVIEEEYEPIDRRSRAIASWQSYDSIKDHCEKIRSYIVAYYQKTKQPIPEFRLKQVTQ